MSSQTIILEAQNIYKKYQGSASYANQNISLSVPQGEIVGLLGPNGAGKTTLVRQMCGLLKPDQGKICLEGTDIVQNPDYAAKRISYLGQIAYTHRALKVMEFLIFTGVYRGLSRRLAQFQAQEFLAYFGMENLKNRLLERLSGGETRIIAFIAAMLGLYPVIILDEPTNDVDPEKRILLWKLVKELRTKCNISFLLVTHNIHEAQDVVDSVAIIQNGQILQSGIPHQIAASLQLPAKILFSLPYDCSPEQLLRRGYEIERLDCENYQIKVEKDKIQDGLQFLLDSTEGKRLGNIKIVLPSLEDIYMNYSS